MENAVWDWDSSGEYIKVRNGSVFVHWQEAKGIIEQLAPMGLPIFDVLIAVTAAVTAYQNESLIIDMKRQLLPNLSEAELQNRLHIFNCIHELDREYRSGANRLVLIATITEKVNRKIIEANSIKIARELHENPTHYRNVRGPKASQRRAKVLSSLEAFSHHFDSAETLLEAMLGFDRTRIQTDALLPELETTEKEYDSVLDALLDNRKTKKMAALIPYIDSGIKIPLHSKRNDNRPEGGVSDLSNKGHFDQLIVSEFAYDDDYFLSRIVNNEALFYQKEPAQKENDNELCVIIDCSIYMWGMSKLLATAITSSLAIKENQTKVVAYCVGEQSEQHDYASVRGIIEANQFVSSSISPANGLQQLIYHGFEHSNVLYITTEKSWKRPEMHAFRGTNSNWYDHILFVNEAAEIQLKKSKGKQLASIKLDPEYIWELREKNAVKPEITVSREYPILFPISNNQIRFTLSFENDVFFVNKSKGLLRFTPNRENIKNTKGAQYLTTVAPNMSSDGDIGYNAKGELEVLLVNYREHKVWVYNVNTQKKYSFPFPHLQEKRRKWWYHENQQFVFVTSEHAYILDSKYRGEFSKNASTPALVEAAKSRARSIRMTFPFHESYLLHAKQAFVTDANELVINSHKLEILDSKFQFINQPSGSSIIKALRERKKEGFQLQFPSGETIFVTHHGVLEFTFAPGKAPLGFELHLDKIGSSKTATIKAISEHLPGLKASKDLVDKGNGLIGVFTDETDAQVYLDWMNSMNNTVSMKKVQLDEKFYLTSSPNLNLAAASNRYFAGNALYRPKPTENQQVQIEIVRFFDLYIKTFIARIRYGV